MRVGIRVTCATIGVTCAGAAAAIAGCTSDDNAAPPQGGLDASFPDVGQPDVGVHPTQDGSNDANVVDTGPQADTNLPPVDAGCQPTSAAAFTPPAYVPPPTVFPFSCFQQPYQGTIVADCFSDAASFAACNGAQEAGVDADIVQTNCLTCLLSPEDTDAGSWGPVVQGVVPIVNVGGCIASHDNSDAGVGCAMTLQAAWQCAEFTCKTACPAVVDDATRAQMLACMRASAIGPCAAYAGAAAACIAAEKDAGDPRLLFDCFDPDGGDPSLGVLDYFCGT